jgi:hypothetical protein
MKLKELVDGKEGDAQSLEINNNLMELASKQVFTIVKGEDFAVSAEKMETTGGVVYRLEYEGKTEIVGYQEPEEYEELEKELKKGVPGERGIKMRIHVHKKPRCRDTGIPAACGQDSCYHGFAMHIACINIPFSSKKLCTCGTMAT